MTDSPGSILAIMAHPDDAELWAGGTLALHALASATMILVASADEVRRTEAAEGARVLGARLELTSEHSVETCARVLASIRPDVVITHRMDDVHPDHRRTAEIVLAALPDVVIANGRPSRLYTCDSYESLTLGGKVEGRVIVDVTSTFETKRAALAVYRSQPLEHFALMAERIGASWGGRIGSRWGEAFDPVPILGRLPAVLHL